MKELMLNNLSAYKEHYELLKLELAERKEEIKKIEKVKKLVEKVGTDIIEVKDNQIDMTSITELEKDIKLCKSIIRRYETLLNGVEE